MTRILIPRGSGGGSSSNPSRTSSLPGTSSARVEPAVIPSNSALKDEELGEEIQELNNVEEISGTSDSKTGVNDDFLMEGLHNDQKERSGDEIAAAGEKVCDDDSLVTGELIRGASALETSERLATENDLSIGDTSKTFTECSHAPPPPPPVPPMMSSAINSNPRRNVSGSSNAGRPGATRRAVGWPMMSRISSAESRPSSPCMHVDNDGYNSADEQNSCFGSSYDDLERERQFEIDIRRAKGLEVKRMLEDGNCLFRAVADQVYGDIEVYDLIRQMCIDYMERERDHFSQFVIEGFTSYCKRKRRDKVYGNNVEIQAMSEMYNRPIHIYSYTTEPINIFHGSYCTDSPPVRLSFHHGNHYNSLVDPRRVTVGAGLGFSSLRGGTNVDKDQVKAAIKAQQDQQIDNALLAEGRFYSDLELTEKEIERMVMEASRAEYVANDTLKQQLGHRESSSGAEPSSSGTRSSGSKVKEERAMQDFVLSSSMQVVLSMGFGYLQVMEAYSIFGDDVDSMVCYLLETGSSSRRKGKATE